MSFPALKARGLWIVPFLSAQAFLLSIGIDKAYSGEQPIAIFHAFNQKFGDVKGFVCELNKQGYTHVQISPAQKSNPGDQWWKRYQPVDYQVIEGLGSERDVLALTQKAHSCNMKVIADVVFNHMANLDGGDGFENLNKFPGLSPVDFKTTNQNPGQRPCEVGDNNGYRDGNQRSEVNCWLGGLPDLNFTANVKRLQKAHLKKMLDLGVDGFRFDAAKHMPKDVLKEYVAYINTRSNGRAWNYLEVIEDQDSKAEDFNSIAAVTDFRLYNSMKGIFSYGGDVRSLPANAVNDSRSVTFGANHDTIKSLNDQAINPYNDITDSYLATSYVLARESGTPLVLNEHNLLAPYLKYGVKFRERMARRGQEGKNVKETILRFPNSSTVVMMQRGPEGLFVLNKSAERFDLPALDLTLSDLEGCYRELRNDFTIAIERKGSKKFVTRWGTWNRGGMEIQGRDALYFSRVPFEECRNN
jgi:alpha-amylase